MRVATLSVVRRRARAAVACSSSARLSVSCTCASVTRLLSFCPARIAALENVGRAEKIALRRGDIARPKLRVAAHQIRFVALGIERHGRIGMLERDRPIGADTGGTPETRHCIVVSGLESQRSLEGRLSGRPFASDHMHFTEGSEPIGIARTLGDAIKLGTRLIRPSRLNERVSERQRKVLRRRAHLPRCGQPLLRRFDFAESEPHATQQQRGLHVLRIALKKVL